MRKEFRIVDEKRQILQITTVGERWYAFEGKNKISGLPEFRFLRSVTWICEYYPKGIPYYKWLANKGWDEAEALKTAAGDKGSKVHQAIGDLLEGKVVEMSASYLNPTTDLLEPLTIEEYDCILSFVRWYDEVNPEILGREFVIINEEENYAGMVDLVCEIKPGKYGREEYSGGKYLVDFKTSQYIWPSHELQVSAYRHGKTLLPIHLMDCKLAILQVGYKKNKNQYKFTEIDDKYDQFLAAKTICDNETRGVEPKQKDYPLSIGLSKENKDERK